MDFVFSSNAMYLSKTYYAAGIRDLDSGPFSFPEKGRTNPELPIWSPSTPASIEFDTSPSELRPFET